MTFSFSKDAPAPFPALAPTLGRGCSGSCWWLIFTVPGEEGSRQEPLIAEPGLVWGKCYCRASGARCEWCCCCWCNGVVAMEIDGIRLGEVRLDPRKN